MSDSARDLLQAALALSIEERAEIAAELLRSLERDERQLPADEVERLWTVEVARRANRALRGESTGRNADEVLRALDSKLR